MDVVTNSTEQVSDKKKGSPMINIIILSVTILLMLTSTITGFISYSKLGKDAELKSIKTLLLFASIVSIFSLLLLGLALFFLFFKKIGNMFLLITLGVTAVMMLIAGILFIMASGKIKKYNDRYKASRTMATLASIINFCSFGAVVSSFVIAMLTSNMMKSKSVKTVETGAKTKPEETVVVGEISTPKTKVTQQTPCVDVPNVLDSFVTL